MPALDTSLRRVVARVRSGVDPDDLSRAETLELATAWIDRSDPGAWNQALMDLGREVCRPRPRCEACPLADGCRFLAAGASPKRSKRRQGPFEGSPRQVRGAIVRVLRDRSPATIGRLTTRTGFEPERVRDAVRDLHREGLILAGASALAGRAAGRVRLPG